MKIPRFGDDYEVPVIEGTSDDALAAGIGHFEGTAAPGQVGNFALAGHRVTHGQPLADMTELEVGDTVVVETADSVYTYTLVTGGDDLRVSFTDGWVIDPLPTNPDPGGCAASSDARRATAHADHVRGALPHRRPARRLRGPVQHPFALDGSR